MFFKLKGLYLVYDWETCIFFEELTWRLLQFLQGIVKNAKTTIHYLQL